MIESLYVVSHANIIPVLRGYKRHQRKMKLNVFFVFLRKSNISDTWYLTHWDVAVIVHQNFRELYYLFSS